MVPTLSVTNLDATFELLNCTLTRFNWNGLYNPFCCHLDVIASLWSHLVKSGFAMTPRKKVQWVEIGRFWWPLMWELQGNHIITKLFFKVLQRCGSGVRSGSILHEPLLAGLHTFASKRRAKTCDDITVVSLTHDFWPVVLILEPKWSNDALGT